MLPSELDSFLDVPWRSGIDADYRHAPLLARNAERSVEVAGLDCAVGRDVRLPVGVFGGPRLIRPPDTVQPTGEDVGAVACGRVVARSGRRDRVDQWLREV